MSVRLAVLSDIHGNYEALRAVLDELAGQRIDAYACLGDIVGYGPEPAQCLHEVQRNNSIIIAGNHEFAVTERLPLDSFNSLAREAIQWTREHLSAGDLEFLAGLPLVEHLDGADLVHGALYTPELFDYVQTSYDACLSMMQMRAQICFLGHSHVPIMFLEHEVIMYSLEKEIRIEPGIRMLVNVGSVGQPRDKDPRACFAVFDTGEQLVQIQRVRYDIDRVVTKMRTAGLPAPLGERLRLGR